MAIQAPLIQPLPVGALVNQGGTPSPGFAVWLQQAFSVLFSQQQSGTTANRPVMQSGLTGGLYVGRRYFDTTLGKPIWISAVSSSGVATWVDATGASV